MRYQLIRLFTHIAASVAVPAVAFAEDAEITLMTYNLRLDIASDGPNQWAHRKEDVAAQIAFLQPDVCGVQEALSQQIEYLDKHLEDYAYVGVGRDDADRAGEFSALLYRVDSVELLDSSTFWLSETPDTPSFGWGAAYRRICTYAHLKDKQTGRTYWVFNTHFDHEVEIARLNAAKLILRRIDQLVAMGEPHFLIGDLNATPDQPPIQLIGQPLNDARTHCDGPVFGSVGTYNDFQTDVVPERRIDYILVSQDTVKVTGYATFSELIDLRYPSDHFPVVIRCVFDKRED